MKSVTKFSRACYCAGLVLSVSLSACTHVPASTSSQNHLHTLKHGSSTSTENVEALPAASSEFLPTSRITNPQDPFEGINRAIFTFNDALDRAAFRPLAKTYNFIVPKGIRTSITNFFLNIGDAYTMLNNYLQGRFTAGSQDLMRLSINSVFGVLGIFDVASQAGLPKHQQDFGQTLGHYGVPPGPYLVLPFLGPSTVRDTVGFMADRTADPTTYIRSMSLRNELFALRFLNTRASLLEVTSLINRVSLDKYISVRNAYLQRRDYLINGNKQALPDYDDDYDDSKADVSANAETHMDENVPPAHMMPPGSLPTLHFH